MNSRRVVVTGMGALTPIGKNIDEFWNGLMEGKSGASLITKFDTEKFTTKFACQVLDFNVDDYLDRKESKRMDPYTHFAIAASKMALDDSKLDLENSSLQVSYILWL